MAWLGRIFRIVRGVIVAAFCVVHLGFVLIYLTREDLPHTFKSEDPGTKEIIESAVDVSKGYCKLTASPQDWGMFAPNVGEISDTPAILVVYADGTQEILHSSTEPRLRNLDPRVNYLLRYSELREREEHEPGLLDYDWKFHHGDARPRKLETYPLEYLDRIWGLTQTRRGFIRWRLIDHLRANKRAPAIKATLYAVKVEHPTLNYLWAMPSNGKYEFYSRSRLRGVRPVCEYIPAEDKDWPREFATEAPKP